MKSLSLQKQALITISAIALSIGGNIGLASATSLKTSDLVNLEQLTSTEISDGTGAASTTTSFLNSNHPSLVARKFKKLKKSKKFHKRGDLKFKKFKKFKKFSNLHFQTTV